MTIEISILLSYLLLSPLSRLRTDHVTCCLHPSFPLATSIRYRSSHHGREFAHFRNRASATLCRAICSGNILRLEPTERERNKKRKQNVSFEVHCSRS
ncbi:hypothetical protein B9Z19DRAFT_2703 [Tuber borchii]|uniref:Secreted protein n=1 Tax=Tuber borchii TaxID=42251 RepID=A0A2T7A9E0_TUBBO|nr:hypothetical protein B9Z19DRAFT_2703 [Tuber borchii]